MFMGLSPYILDILIKTTRNFRIAGFGTGTRTRDIVHLCDVTHTIAFCNPANEIQRETSKKEPFTFDSGNNTFGFRYSDLNKSSEFVSGQVVCTVIRFNTICVRPFTRELDCAEGS